VLRHVSPAFAEDPVRILRVARFAARFGFTVAPETQVLMMQMVRAGEADALVAERVWQELAKGLMEKAPSAMFAILRDCGALGRVLPQLDVLYEQGGISEALAALEAIAHGPAALEVRFAVLLRALQPEAVDALCARLRAPAACRDLALLAARHGHALADAAELDAEELFHLLEAADAWRRPERFRDLVDAALAGVADCDAARTRLHRAHDAALAVDAGAVARTRATPDAIKAAVAQARLEAIRDAIKI
jgi:tRNA nucleotidyltransferase (CCA-adding enzyme)